MKSLTEKELGELLRKAWMRGHRAATPGEAPILTPQQAHEREDDVAQLIQGGKR